MQHIVEKDGATADRPVRCHMGPSGRKQRLTAKKCRPAEAAQSPTHPS